MEPVETHNAGKDRLGPEQALELARAARTVLVARGKQLLTFEMAGTPPSDEDLLAVMLGRSGKLRAPTLRLGDKLLVGYSADAYREALA